MFRNAVQLSHFYLERAIKPGCILVDATMGNGHDTVFLAELAGEQGKVYAFDVQAQALVATRNRLEKKQLLDRVSLILDSHENMAKYVSKGVQAISFNLGRLPGSDFSVYTQAKSTIAAIEAGLLLLKPGGLISLAAYWGDEICRQEYFAVRQYLETLAPERAEVLCHEFINEPHYPPVFFAIFKPN